MKDDFSTNLGLLCSYHRSIAEVCRKLGFTILRPDDLGDPMVKAVKPL